MLVVALVLCLERGQVFLEGTRRGSLSMGGEREGGGGRGPLVGNHTKDRRFTTVKLLQ